MAQMPETGDNFALVGPWRLLSGETWFEWEVAALEAEIRASRAVGDALTVRRLSRRLRQLRQRGARPVAVAVR